MKLIFLLTFMATASIANASDSSSCQSAVGRAALVKEYVANGGMAPACGPQCAHDFILSQVCSLEVKATCLTEAGQNLKIKEFVDAGNSVPSCGPNCARDYILSQVCPKTEN